MVLSEKLVRLSASDKDARRNNPLPIDVREPSFVASKSYPQRHKRIPRDRRGDQERYVLGRGHKYHLQDSNPVDYI